jgi:hypothetical protein
MIERTEQRLDLKPELIGDRRTVVDADAPTHDAVEQPTLIELSINMQTARALDIVILDALFARAERVVE